MISSARATDVGWEEEGIGRALGDGLSADDTGRSGGWQLLNAAQENLRLSTPLHFDFIE